MLWEVQITCLLIAILLRRCLYNRSAQQKIHSLSVKGFPLAPLLQPHVFVVLVLFGFYCDGLVHLFMLFESHSYLEPKFPESVLQHVDASKLNELNINTFLRVMCVVAPFSIAATFLVTILHVFKHLPANRGFDENLRWCPSYSHDMAIQVALLPLVYGVFAMQSICAMLSLVTGEVFENKSLSDTNVAADFKKTTARILQTCYANMQFADLCEAWALRGFALLCFMRVARQIHLEVPTVRYMIETVKMHMMEGNPEENRDSRILDDLVILNSPEELLFEPLQQTANIGVMVFVYTYAIKSIYLLILNMFRDAGVDLCDGGPFAFLCGMQSLVDGAVLLASVLAIYNLVVFEHKLKAILEKQMFKPFKKFLSVKIFVSIAFFQNLGLQMVLGRIRGLSDAQVALWYVSLLAVEVLPLSVLVYFAWRPMPNDWYDDDCYFVSATSDKAQVGHMAGERRSRETSRASFVASRQLVTMVGSDDPVGYNVAATLELHGRVTAVEGSAIVDIINKLSTSITAVYRPAALFRARDKPGSAAGLARNCNERSSDISTTEIRSRVGNTFTNDASITLLTTST